MRTAGVSVSACDVYELSVFATQAAVATLRAAFVLGAILSKPRVGLSQLTFSFYFVWTWVALPG